MIDLTDMFCGCGGSSQGAKKVAGVQVKYALNHWKLAIESHNTNHPDTHHDCADISETHPARYSRTTGLIASPECTNHTLAKGHRRKNLNQQEIFQNKAFDPAAVRSRATMWDVPRFAEVHKYEFIIVENVVEVRYWVMYNAWIQAMHSLGYLHECVYLNAMFAHSEDITGFAPQSRDRIYIVFWKKGNKKPDLNIRPIAPCSRCGTVEAYQSWKPNRKAGKFKTQYVYRCSLCNEQVLPYYYAAINALDLSIPMVRIGDREKPLSVNTIARIEYGLKKFGLKPTLLNQAQASGIGNRVKSAADDPIDCQTTRKSSYLFSPFLFEMAHSHSKNDRTRGFTDWMPTQTTQQSMAMVAPFFGIHRGKSKVHGVADPLATVTTGGIHSSIVIPPSAILTLRGSKSFDGMTDALPTQVAAAIQNYVVSKTPFLTAYHGGSHQAANVFAPTYTIPTGDSMSYIEAMDQPKIEDCYFRMLQPSETARAQGFPEDYVILGSKDNQQKQIGNANPPPTMELLVARCVDSLK